MKIRVLSAEKTKQTFIKEGEREYLKRLPRDLALELVEHTGKRDLVAELRELKSKRWYLVLLDEGGRGMGSTDFSELLSKKMLEGFGNFAFAIGPAEGWEPEDRTIADLTLSLSPMTFTYQMTRLILVEQLYRAFSILRGTPYHK